MKLTYKVKKKRGEWGINHHDETNENSTLH